MTKININRTKVTDIWDAIVSISAQETTPGQTLSNWIFILSITSKPLTELLFASDSFSLCIVGLLSNKSDPSQPFKSSTNLINQFLFKSNIRYFNYVSNYIENKMKIICNILKGTRYNLTFTKQSWKWSLFRLAAIRGSVFNSL